MCLGQPNIAARSCDRLPRPKSLTRGMTLVELLVVVAIIMMLAAVTIPRLRPDIDRARIREAARSVQLYLSSARNLAITTGRSCGVQIERLANHDATGKPILPPLQAGASASLSQIESPVGYCGEATPSLVDVSIDPNNSSQAGVAVKLTFKPQISPGVVRVGDMIQLGLQGPLYTMTSVTTSASSGTLDVSQGLSVPWPVGDPPLSVPYKVFRQAIKSSAAPLQLPNPAVIDLTYSGLDTLYSGPTPQYWYSNANDTTPIQILFAPDGSVDRIYVDNQVIYPTTTICLLIGSLPNVNDPNPANSNLQDFNNLWVSINPRTGLIVTTSLAGTGTTPAQVYTSRTYARQSNAQGGN
jgi:type II secretory pathway pseudopilin PulG